MGELVITTFLSLDGIMQAPGGPQEDVSGGFKHGGWIAPFSDPDGGRIINEIYSNLSAFLLGRVTYDIFAAYWPVITDPANAMAARMNGLPKFVASRTRSTFDWSGSTHVTDVVKEVPALKQRLTGDLLVVGSGELARTLIQNDLIDEYRLMTFPVVLGTGKRLFGNSVVPAALKLVKSSVTGTGVVYNVYRRAGPLKVDSL